MSDPAPRRLAVMFTDMVGYSALMQRDQALSLRMLEEHRAITRPVLAQYRGREVKTIGDAFLVVFESTADAVACALAIQVEHRLRNLGKPREPMIEIRIGLHVGSVVERDGDVYGDDVNVAARVEPLAQPGGVCVSAAVYKEVVGTSDANFVRLGKADLKNVSGRDLYAVYPKGEKRTGDMRARARFFARQGRVRRAAVLGVIAVLAGVAFWNPVRRLLRPTIRRIAVLDFENTTGQSSLDSVPGMLRMALAQSPEFRVTTRERMIDLVRAAGSDSESLQPTPSTLQAARQAGAEAAVQGRISLYSEQIAIEIQLVDVNRGAVYFSVGEIAGHADVVPAAIDRIARKIRTELRLAESAEIDVAVATTANLDAYRLFTEGERFVSRGEFARAERNYRSALDLDPDFVLARYRLAYALSWTGSVEAGAEVKRALEGADRLQALDRRMLRALDAKIRHDVPIARRELEGVVAADPDGKEGVFALGDLLLHDGEVAASIPRFERVLALDPDYDAAREHLVWAYQLLGRYEEALQQTRVWVTRRPSSRSYVELLRMLVANRRWESAEEFRALAEQAYPEAPELPGEVMTANVFRGDAAKSEELLRDALRATKEPRSRFYLHRALSWVQMYRGRASAADAASRMAAETSPSEEHWRRSHFVAERAYFAAAAGNRRGALEAIGELRAGEGDRYVALDVLLACSAMQDDACVAAWSSDQTEPFIRDLLDAAAASARGDHDAARASLEHAEPRVRISLKPLVWFQLAKVEAAAGRREKALAWLDRVRTHPLFGDHFAVWYPRALHLRGRIEEEAGNRDAAAAAYREFLEVWKDADSGLPELADAKSRLAGLK